MDNTNWTPPGIPQYSMVPFGLKPGNVHTDCYLSKSKIKIRKIRIKILNKNNF
jgi:hypothetical protein